MAEEDIEDSAEAAAAAAHVATAGREASEGSIAKSDGGSAGEAIRRWPHDNDAKVTEHREINAGEPRLFGREDRSAEIMRQRCSIVEIDKREQAEHAEDGHAEGFPKSPTEAGSTGCRRRVILFTRSNVGNREVIMAAL